MTSESPPATDQQQLVRDVADLRIVIKVMLGVVFAGISYLSFRMLLVIPNFERIFEDMLGDLNKLPHITKMVIDWSRLGLIPMIILGGLIITGFVFLLSARSIRTAGFAFVMCAIPLLLHLLICWTAMFEPLITVVKGLSGPSAF